MEKSELELYFDKYIANASSSVVEEEKEGKEDQSREDLGEVESCRLLPDEPLTLTTQKIRESSGLKNDSQNASAAVQLPGGSSTQESVPQPVPVVPLLLQRPTSLKITNVMSSVKLGCRLDLTFIAANTWNVIYNPQKINVLYMKLRRPRVTANIFASGSMICTGAQSVGTSRVAARRIARILQKLGVPVRFLNFKIVNIVASCTVSAISLQQMSLSHHCSYEPELFPGLFFHVMPGISISIFSNGKMTITGAKTEADLHKALEEASLVLNQFRK